MLIPIERYPQLRLLCWNRPSGSTINGRDALSLYERNWRFVDTKSLTNDEQNLLNKLVKQYGNGVLIKDSLKVNSRFRMEHHNLVLKVLNKLNGSFLEQSDCYFGGGTAIALALNEYRKSVDIDFLCASQTGYRQLRSALWGNGLKGLVNDGENLQEIRETRSDQYGIRTVIEIDNTPIKFEIVREARIDLSGKFNSLYQVPVLDKTSLFAEKLLANADRGFDTNTMNRDIIDISMMIHCWGDIPETAWKRAADAYGERTIKEAYEKSVASIQNETWLCKCMEKMDMEEHFADKILSVHAPSTINNSLSFSDPFS